MAPQAIPPVPPQTTTDGAGTKASGLKDLKSGDTTIDDKLAFEVELASYKEVHCLTKALKNRLDRHLSATTPTVREVGIKPVQLFFLDNALRMALDTSSVIDLQLKNLRGAYQGAVATAMSGIAALTAAAQPDEDSARRGEDHGNLLKGFDVPSAAADAAVALLNALRTDTRYFGRQVTIPEQAFALTLAHEWEDDALVEFHYPTLFLPPMVRRTEMMRTFIKQLDGAVQARKVATEAVAKLLVRVSQLQAESTEFPLAKATLDSARDQLSAADAVFDDLSSKLTKPDEKTGLTQLQLLERAAFVRSIAKKADKRTFYLFAQVVSAGGAFRISKNVLRTLFWGDGLEHAGGCLLTFGLFNDEGRLVASDTIGSRSKYQDSRPSIRIG